MSQATLTIVPAPALALLAHCLRELSTTCKEARGVNVLLTLSETPQALGYGTDGYLKNESDDLNGV